MLLCKIQDFSEKIESRHARPLSGLSIELTRRCNFSCRHCYLANRNDLAHTQQELTSEEWISIFDQYVELEGMFLTVTGGEPLLRKDFKQLWESMKARGFIISLFTNGSLLDQGMVNFLAQNTPLDVSITLYGCSEETYRAVTGVKNMFSRVISSLDMLSRAGIPVEVKGVFTKLNIADFDKVKAIAERYCELFRWDVDLIGSFDYSSNRPQDIRLSAKECAQFEAAEPIRNQELINRFSQWNPPSIDKSDLRVFTCGVGYYTAYIDSIGGLHPCLPLEKVSYDLKCGTLKRGWQEAIPEMLKNFPHQPGPCQICDGIELCGQCVAFALLEGCSATGPVPYKCELARERAEIYGLAKRVKNIPGVRRIGD